jgi:hypothetical protein
MSTQIIGNAGVVAEVDEARNIQVYEGIAGYPAAGGFYTVTGQAATTGTPATPLAVAAALANNTMLMSARLAAGSTRKAYITKIRILLVPITGVAAAVVPGSLGIQRFTAQTPTGGNARTAARLGEAKGTATDITDIRDSNAALTGTAPTFGTVLGSCLIPVVIGAVAAGYTEQNGIEWIFESATPVELAAGDGICLRTQTTCPATATWTYSYNLHWFER